MKHFEEALQVYSGDELVGVMQEAPNKRMLVYTSDLSDDEFDERGFSIRTDDCVLLVVEGSDPRDYQKDAVVAVVGDETDRDAGGRRIPASISKLMMDAEEWCGPLAIMFEDVFVLVDHPGAERRS